MTRVLVAGAGVSGLACSLSLAKAMPSIGLTVVDVRAEPGVPMMRPGLLGSKAEVIEALNGLGIEDSAATPLSIGEGALRREWLVKALAIAAARSGCTVSPRTRLVFSSSNGSSMTARLHGAGPSMDGDHEFDLVIDALGSDPDPVEGEEPPRQAMSDGVVIRSGDALVPRLAWHGIVTSVDRPPLFEGGSGPSVSPMVRGGRSDGTVEWWSDAGRIETDRALERMRCLGGDEVPTVASSLARAAALSAAALDHLSRAARP